MALSTSRFEALDAWRGVCALLVAVFHLQAYSHIYDWSLVRHSFLFVDFFFVLSGFVIAGSYRAKLLDGFSIWHFMLLRLGRLYPLHLAILVIFIGIELLRYRFSGILGGENGDRFTDAHSAGSIVTNLLLIQSLNIHKMLTWNLPSWSISVEFYAYAVFAISLLMFRQRTYILIALVVLAAPLVLLKLVGNIDTDHDYGFIRCLFGFFVGVACCDIYGFVRRHYQKIGQDISGKMWSIIEVCSVGLVASFVCWFGDGPSSLAAPIVFGLTVLVFSFEGGFVSSQLKLPAFLFLGQISYSIYMVHALVLVAMGYGIQLGERAFGTVLRRGGYFGADMWQGDLAYGVLILLTVSAAYLTYRFIEAPGRTQSRRIANRIFGTNASPVLPSANSGYGETSLGDETGGFARQ